MIDVTGTHLCIGYTKDSEPFYRHGLNLLNIFKLMTYKCLKFTLIFYLAKLRIKQQCTPVAKYLGRVYVI